jgi:hypothetical protein
MKKILVFVFAFAAWLRAVAQVDVELAMDQDQFLPNESLRLAVKIINHSGQTLHLGTASDWLTFAVESSDNFVVVKNSDVPVVEPFDLESSQMATKRVDLQPYFVMSKPGRYKVVATLHIPEWSVSIASAPKHFDIIGGAELWAQDFGVTFASQAVPEARRYSLIKANFLHEQLMLYVQVSSRDTSRIFKVAPLGSLVSFGSPEAQVDPISRLHVLWQTGAQSFTCATITPDGLVTARDIYDCFNTRPHMAISNDGEVLVQGGVRRIKASEAPAPVVPQTSSNAPKQ